MAEPAVVREIARCPRHWCKRGRLARDSYVWPCSPPLVDGRWPTPLRGRRAVTRQAIPMRQAGP